MISERQNEILKALVKEYIKTAEPISSESLAKKHDFGLCPSAIRIEMNFLIKTGYLEQPHTSAGRIPTDKAYRYFVDFVLTNQREEKKENKIEEIIEGIIKEKMEDRYKLASRLAKFLADTSSGFAIVHFLNNDLSWKEGWEEIAKEPEFKDNDFIQSFVGLLQDFEEKIKKFDVRGVKIFIGKEIPLPHTQGLSLICSSCPISKSEKAFISILGPKRMDYNRNINLIYSLHRALGDLA
ncbi:MAG: hypothetical protein WC520_00550 [Candidatus Paceibacterota bacterium]